MNNEANANSSVDSLATPEERKARYKKTLNLPQTSFPMRANLAQNEPQSLARWARQDLYSRLLAERATAPLFVFHDGPPFANGTLHLGHLLNKVLKDIVVRSQNMAGRQCAFVPGWDCHGLPIEHKVMTELIAGGKLAKLQELDDNARRTAVRRECERYASKYQRLQAEQMQRLLTLADYGHPYLTMTPTYEQAVLEVFAELVAQGLVYRELKPVHWSIANQTALAEAELEYMNRLDPSVYVDFPATDPEQVATAFGCPVETTPGFLIWTTTPWTLPANRLIAVHPSFQYGLFRVADRLLVIASQLAAQVLRAAGLSDAQKLAEAPGAALLGLTYQHLFAPLSGRVVTAEHVTLEDGTGLVHTAPGHGHEDYALGMREGVVIYSPVEPDGRYDDSVPDWLRGDLVWDANPKIIEHLRQTGHLFASLQVEHSYPHDWRSKTPVIFRCTEQWFIAVDRPTRRDGKSLRELALHACETGIQFIPGWGQNRLRGMLEARPDWCISRQRSWGLPIPAFRCPDGQMFLTAASTRAVAQAFGQRGSNAWFAESPAQLLSTYEREQDPDAPPGLDLKSLEPMYDIFDVWMESGSSWNAVMRQRGLGFPVDLYLEGSDQHRGWFQLSLLPALGATGRAPFKALLTHGFMVNKEGRKMSKSLGNTLEVDELLRHFGADVCRWWTSSLAFEADIKADLEFFELAGESYRKVRNTLRFLLSNLYDWQPSGAWVPPPQTSLDARALTLAAEMRRRVLAAYLSYDFRQAHLLLFDFCNETLSAFYLNAVKDRLYCDAPDSPRRRATQAVLWQITELLSCLLAPLLPHTADESYRALLRDEEACVHLAKFPELEATADPAWPQVMRTRESALKALEEAKARGIENPLDAGVVLPDPEHLLERFAADWPDLLGVSRVSCDPQATEISIDDLREEPRCERSWRRDKTVRQRKDGGWLSDRDAQAVGLA